MAWRLKSNTSARKTEKRKDTEKKEVEKEKKRKKKRIKYKEIWRLKSKTGGIGLVYFTCPICHKISERSLWFGTSTHGILLFAHWYGE